MLFDSRKAEHAARIAGNSCSEGDPLIVCGVRCGGHSPTWATAAWSGRELATAARHAPMAEGSLRERHREGKCEARVIQATVKRAHMSNKKQD